MYHQYVTLRMHVEYLSIDMFFTCTSELYHVFVMCNSVKNIDINMYNYATFSK